MRISTNLQFLRGLTNLQTSQQRLDKVQLQLTKQTRILSPADDPIGNSQVLNLNEKIGQNEQFDRNSITLENNLGREESVLSNIVTAVQRARVLAVQAGNGSYSAENREALALELRQIEQAVFDFSNTQDESGEYIFAGFQNRIQPMEFDELRDVYEYVGDDGQRTIQLSPTLKMPAGDPGSSVFTTESYRLDLEITNGGLVREVSVTDRQAAIDFQLNNWDAGDPGATEFNINFLAANSYEIVDGNGTVLQGPTAYNSGDSIEFNGISFQPNRDAVAGDTIAYSIGEPVARNVLTQIRDLADALEGSLDDKGLYRAEIASALDSFTGSIDTLTDVQASVGARLNVMESARLSNADLAIVNKKARSDISDVDYSVAVTDLIKNETIYSASQQVFSRISNLSLFDFLR